MQGIIRLAALQNSLKAERGGMTNLGIRVVHKVDGIMKIIVVSARTDEQVYKGTVIKRLS